MSYEDRNKKNMRMMGMLFGLVALMVALAFASVPLYDLFCRVTGYAGTTGVAAQLPDKALDRQVRVRFHTDTAKDLPWTFKAEQSDITVNLGQGALNAFWARNDAAQPVGGTAIYNVNPQKAGRYFKKIQCFCFDEQILEAGKRISMPVYFYIDPAMDDDPFLKDVKTITLSYSFFPSESEALDEALEAFYQTQ